MIFLVSNQTQKQNHISQKGLGTKETPASKNNSGYIEKTIRESIETDIQNLGTHTAVAGRWALGPAHQCSVGPIGHASQNGPPIAAQGARNDVNWHSLLRGTFWNTCLLRGKQWLFCLPRGTFLAFFTERIFLLLCIFYFFGNRPMGLNNIIATNEVPNKSIRKASVGTTSDPKKNSWSCLAVSLRISGIAYNRTAPIMTP